MKIEYFGHSCFRITSSAGVRVVTDPYTNVGYELPKAFIADVVTISHGHFDHNYVDGVQGAQRVWDCAGEHAYNGVLATAYHTFHDAQKGALRGDNLVFKLNIDGVSVCHFGDFGEEYSNALVERLGKVDILLIPVGGTYTIDARTAKKFVDSLQPKIVIPMHYKPKDGKIDITDEQPFLALYGEQAKNLQSVNEVVIEKGDILNDGAKIIFMERKA